MTDDTYSLVVSMLIAGGFVGSLVAPIFNDRFGRRWTLFVNNIFLAGGSTLMGLAASVNALLWGRFLIGVGCGVITVVGPTYMSEIAPEALRGTFGVVNQIGVVKGILFSQILGVFLSTLPLWRYILLAGTVLSLLQVVALLFCVESPRYLASKPGGFHAAKASLQRLRGAKEVDNEINSWRRDWAAEAERDEDDEEHRLIQPTDAAPTIEPVNASTTPVTIWEFITSPVYRHPLLILFLFHTAQQFSGINAVIFYSNSIMSSITPASSDIVTIFISIINLLMTLISAILMDRAGRRTLFLYSAGVMSFITFLLAFGIEQNLSYLSAITIVGFVAAFAIGLGPIPFLIIPEIVDTQAVSAAGSFALATNWVSNFIVSSTFLSVRNALGGGGKVFLLFAMFLAYVTFAGYKIVPETKGRSVEEVIKSNWALTA